MGHEGEVILQHLRRGPVLLGYNLTSSLVEDPETPQLDCPPGLELDPELLEPKLVPQIVVTEAWESEAGTPEAGDRQLINEICDHVVRVGMTQIVNLELMVHLDGYGDKLVTIVGHLGTNHGLYRPVRNQVAREDFDQAMKEVNGSPHLLDTLIWMCVRNSRAADLGQIDEQDGFISPEEHRLIAGLPAVNDAKNMEDSEDDVDTVIMLRPGPLRRLAGAITGTLDRMANLYWGWQQNNRLEEDDTDDEREAA